MKEIKLNEKNQLKKPIKTHKHMYIRRLIIPKSYPKITKQYTQKFFSKKYKIKKLNFFFSQNICIIFFTPFCMRIFLKQSI